jgi:hypothetical protein
MPVDCRSIALGCHHGGHPSFGRPSAFRLRGRQASLHRGRGIIKPAHSRTTFPPALNSSLSPPKISSLSPARHRHRSNM